MPLYFHDIMALYKFYYYYYNFFYALGSKNPKG